MDKDQFLTSYLNHEMHRNLDLRLEMNDGKSTLSCVISNTILNLVGIVHGAIYFKLMDDACFFAALSIENSHFVATADFNIHYIKPASKGRLTAYAHIVNHRKNRYLCACDIKNDAGELCAHGTGTFVEPKTKYSYKR
ncbi:thioesterase [Candidatus Marinamargulisbacteria bacterium SCGC AG-343-D04]|nr:thioesterase [Candidatus Marinamargulisbacteria bacterium SCGC AG-343-D04]